MGDMIDRDAVMDALPQIWAHYGDLKRAREIIAALPAVKAGVLCTWPSCGHTAKGQCNPTAHLAALEPMTQHAPTAGERLIAAAKDALEGRVSVAYDPQPAPDARLRAAVAQLDAGATLADFTKAMTDAAAVAMKAREAALREAAVVATNLKGNGWDDCPPAHPYDRGYLRACEIIAERILALLPEKPHDRA